MMTGHPGIFAGGDMIPGERSVTISVGHGKRAARHIDAWLRGERYQQPTRHPLVTFNMLHLPVYTDADPSPQKTLAAVQRVRTFEEVGGGRDDDPFVLGRSLAHELGHELALQHVENIGMSGTVYPDPLADTMIGQANLMEPTGGSLLTAGQTYALRRSAFLRTK